MNEIKYNKFPKKSNKEMMDIKNKFKTGSIGLSVGALTLSVGVGHLDGTAHAEIDKNLTEFNYIEKEATSLDPSIHASMSDLKAQEGYVTSSLESKVEKSDEDEYASIVDEDNESFLKLTNNDYLQYVSSNGDVVSVHYIDNYGKLLASDDDIEDGGQYSSNSHTHSGGGWFIYPFILGGNGYHSNNSGLINNQSSKYNGGSAYSNKLTPSIKSNISNVPNTTSSIKANGGGLTTSKSSNVSKSSSGLGSSMKASTSRGGGFGG